MATKISGGEWAIFRLTLKKYRYNHMPVSGRVADFYELDGCFHSCNPAAIIEVVSAYSKNRRSVTIIDTDVDGRTEVGLVAVIEVVALIVGEIVQCYCESGYQPCAPLSIGRFVRRGAVKSLFRPGSRVIGISRCSTCTRCSRIRAVCPS